jgi:propanol-preferring alcohol dehydrogenase
MHAMVLNGPGQSLQMEERPTPIPGPDEVLLRVQACAVCRTDLHLLDGELPDIHYPIVPGHEIVGVVETVGENVQLELGQKLGVPWLGWTCGQCQYCNHAHENLCDYAQFTGYHRDGGFATHVLADAAYCLPIPDAYSAEHAAPLLCAGLIGYRALRMCGENVNRLGIYGFGAAAHIVTQVAKHQGKNIYAFTRPGDSEAQHFARSLGACWAGDSDQHPGVELDSAIIFAPVGNLVPQALRAVRKGGAVICGGIHMSDIPSFPYSILWGERKVMSVANLTRRDGTDFLSLAPQVPVVTEIERFPLAEANTALQKLRHGQLKGAAVLVME